MENQKCNPCIIVFQTEYNQLKLLLPRQSLDFWRALQCPSPRRRYRDQCDASAQRSDGWANELILFLFQWLLWPPSTLTWGGISWIRHIKRKRNSVTNLILRHISAAASPLLITIRSAGRGDFRESNYRTAANKITAWEMTMDESQGETREHCRPRLAFLISRRHQPPLLRC